MKSKVELQPDYIKWVLDLNSGNAEQELHKLIKSTDELKKANEGLEKNLELYRSNRKLYNKEFHDTSAELKANNKAIAENKLKITALTGQIKLGDLSMSQLKNRLRDLSRQLNHTSKALHPLTWDNLNRQLIETKKRVGELSSQSAILNGKLKESGQSAVMWGNLWAIYGTRVIDKMREVTSESITMASSADGVQHAFDRLDSPGFLQSLRKATKGTVNDLQMMTAAVRAKDFRIPLEDLGTYLQYAQLKAQQTGQSVEYMTDSIIMGLGRQSVKILDNLGLSAMEINEEVAKTGDFLTGVATIIKRQIAEAGGAYESAADRATQASIRVQNAQLRLGQSLIPLKENYTNFFTGVAVGFMNFIGYLVRHRALVVPAIALMVTLTAAFLRYKTVVNATNIIQKLWNVLAATSKVVVSGLSAAYLKLTGHTYAAARAQVVMRQAFASTPWGAIITIVTTLAAIFFTLRNKLKDNTESLDALGRVEKRFSEMTDDTSARVQSLSSIIHNNNTELSVRQKALADLKKIMPDYHASLTAEGNLIDDNTDAIKRYVEANEKRMKAEAAMAELSPLYEKQRQAQATFDKAQATWENDKLRAAAGKIPGWVAALSSQQVDLAKKELEAITSDVDKLEAVVKDSLSETNTDMQSLIAIQQKLREQAESMPETTEAEISAKNRKLQLIDKEISRLQELGKVKEKTVDPRTEDLQSAKNSYETSLLLLNNSLQDKKISQQQYDVISAKMATDQAAQLLEIERRYATDKYGVLDKSNKDYIAAQIVYDNAVLNEKEEFNKNIDSLMSMSYSGNMTDREQIEQDYQVELAALESYYLAARELASGNDAEMQRLLIAYLNAVESIKAKYRDRTQKADEDDAEDEKKRVEQVEREKADTRERYGLTSWRQQLDAQLAELKDAHDKQIISDKEYLRLSRQLKVEAWKAEFDKYKSLFSDAFQSLQDAELAQVDAKYDGMISAAEKAGQDTTALEEKKESEKLEIQKKYADVNFAIKASQIIADTAVAIMKGYADLGPIVGSIYAALIGTTGAAQLAIADAERSKILNMTSGSSSTTSTGGQRVLTGLESGGSLQVIRRQDGRQYDDVRYDPYKRGYINRPTVIVGEGPQSKEWVASNAAVTNPTVAPFLNILDNAQRAGTIRTLDLNKIIKARMAGLAGGGYIAAPAPQSPTQSKDDTSPSQSIDFSVLSALNETLRLLQKNGIPAAVALTDLDRQYKLRDAARKIGSKR